MYSVHLGVQFLVQQACWCMQSCVQHAPLSVQFFVQYACGCVQSHVHPRVCNSLCNMHVGVCHPVCPSKCAIPCATCVLVCAIPHAACTLAHVTPCALGSRAPRCTCAVCTSTRAILHAACTSACVTPGAACILVHAALHAACVRVCTAPRAALRSAVCIPTLPPSSPAVLCSGWDGCCSFVEILGRVDNMETNKAATGSEHRGFARPPWPLQHPEGSLIPSGGAVSLQEQIPCLCASLAKTKRDS